MPKGLEKNFWRPPPSLISGVWMTGTPIFWRSGSTTVMTLPLNIFSTFITLSLVSNILHLVVPLHDCFVLQYYWSQVKWFAQQVRQNNDLYDKHFTAVSFNDPRWNDQEWYLVGKKLNSRPFKILLTITLPKIGISFLSSYIIIVIWIPARHHFSIKLPDLG